MPDTALVIGIDGYGPEAWRLGGAVSDAVDFSYWLTTAGGVRPENLVLLLSPLPDAPPVDLPQGAVVRGEAASHTIADAIADLQNTRTGGDRLWVYYAGHGASVRWFPEPVLIPADVADLQRQGQWLIGLHHISRSLVEAPFAEQLFLIDACRDFALENYRPPAILPAVGPYSPAGDPEAEIADERPLQYTLYSVAPGKRAVETGRGVWTQTLLEGLDPRKLSYQVSERGNQPGGRLRWEIRLDAMSEWLRRRVVQRIARLPKSAQLVQKPEYEPDPRGGDPVLLAFDVNQAPRAQVEVFVEPEVAHETCRIAVLEYDGLGRERVTEASGPPVVPPASFSLLPSFYSFRAEAEQYTLASKPWTVHDGPVVELKLEKVSEPSALLRGSGVPESYSVPGDSMVDTDDGFVDPYGPSRGTAGSGRRREPARSLSPPPTGRLAVSFPDPLARVELLGDGEPTVGVGGLPLQILTPGIYRLRVRLPGVPPVERTVEVRAGSDQELRLEAPAPKLGQGQLELLRRLDMFWELEEVVQPAETLGPVAGARLASLLAFATFAAQQVGPGLEKLRGFGVHRLAPPSGGGGLITLVGWAADPGEELGTLLASARLRLRRPDGASGDDGGFSRLAGMPAAAQRLATVGEPGPLVAELHLEGFTPTCYAVTVLPGRVSVLIAVAEADGSVEVQQYLLPAAGVPPVVPPGTEYLDRLKNLRRLELAQSFYAAGQRQQALSAVVPAEPGGKSLDELLMGKWLDPLLGCLAGYVLVGNGEAQELFDPHSDLLQVLADPEGAAAAAARKRGPDHSALRNLLVFFPELPDVHVLAGMCDPVEVRRSGHFERALRRGLPIFAEGARALAAWARREGVMLPAGLAEPLAGLLPGSPWTAWEATSGDGSEASKTWKEDTP